MINKQSRIKSLAWKYFRQQKWKEISDFWEEYWGEICGMMVFSGVFLQMGWIQNEAGKPSLLFIAIIGICFIGLWIIIGIIALIKRTYEWLHGNWIKAYAKARKEIK